VILHTLNAGPDSAAFQDCLRLATRGDAIMLTGDGLYAALDNSPACEALRNSGAEIHVLDVDALAAGIAERICPQARRTDFDGFVALTERFPRQLAWY
jgi:tRNA 2-thiouridine synthesizing protein B